MKCIKNLLLLFILIGTKTACQNAEKNQKPTKNRPKYFAVNIFVGGGPEHPSFNASLFTPDMFSPSFSPGFTHLKMGTEASTLYILKPAIAGATPDTFKLKFESQEIDTLYMLSYDLLFSYYRQIDNIEESTEGMPSSDQRPIIVTLIYGGNEGKDQQSTHWTTSSIFSLSKEASELFHFINKRVPKDFQLH